MLRRVFKGSPLIYFGAFGLLIFGSFMIVSAEMGNAAGDMQYLLGQIGKQCLFIIAGILGYFLILGFTYSYRRRSNKLMKKKIYWILYIIMLAVLLVCRVFGQTNGAYAWIPLGPISIQPSEFCKLFIIFFADKFIGSRAKGDIRSFKEYALACLIYVIVVAFYQHDIGSAMVILIIGYCMLMCANHPQYRKIQKVMAALVLLAIGLVVLILSPIGTSILLRFKDDYRIARILVAANPFLYRYDSGYHLIMSLVSMANGGLKGLGYTKSIHKYMNFPNPSNDFILPVIIEELGIVGLLSIIIGYACILGALMYHSLKSHDSSCKIILVGVFMYFVCHFILNVGGVSGLIPLTGVPLLLISSGGSSLLSCMMSLAYAQSEIAYQMDLKDA